jgi:hypothetical protein
MDDEAIEELTQRLAYRGDTGPLIDSGAHRSADSVELLLELGLGRRDVRTGFDLSELSFEP